MMGADPLLPIAPARVKAVVLPVGPVKRQRFASFLERLAAEEVVHLRDISPDSRPNRNMFSPLAFPSGAIFYDLATHLPHPAHLALSPFDLYREPLVVLAVADGTEMDSTTFVKRQSGGGRSNAERNMRSLYQELEELRDQFPKVLVHRLLIFDYVERKEERIPIPEDIIIIPPPEQCKRTTMRTVMCDVSSMLLAEMTALARSFEALSYIDSPGQTSTARQLNGASWGGGEDAAGLSRRNSQHSLPVNARSSSVAAMDRAQNRMSMPVPFKAGSFSSSSTPARPSTPVKSGLSNPPTSADEANGTPDLSNSDPATPDQGYPSRPGTAEGFRTLSQDRVSVQGFGPGGLNDRWRSKGKCRVTIVIGSLYLQAGRWTDALRELIEGATVAKSINDHIWHGKALELIVICLLLLGWGGIEFQVPTICLPPVEKTSASVAAAAAAAMAQDAAGRADPNQPRWLRNLQAILPELLDRTIALYSRISAEHLPPLPLAETTIRFCKILSAMHVTEGQLTGTTIELLVSGSAPGKILTSSPRLTVQPSRTMIVATLFKAFPNSGTELLSTVDRIRILTGIASVLGTLGYQRKKAMVIRELVSVLIGGLVEARTRGAAEVGIHPAAGLATLNGVNGQTTGAAALELGEEDIEVGMDGFLGLLLRTYGVVGFDVAAMMAPASKPVVDDSDFNVVLRIQRQASARFFGMPSLKLNILRACINFSEALPDFAGVLKYSSDLLRTAGSGVAPGPRREDAAPIVGRDEQIRLITNVLKTSSLSQRLGMGRLDGEYWDEFFLRGVKLEPLPPARSTIEHKKSELAGAATARTSQDLDPLIYNPFLKPPDKVGVEPTLVAGEPATFKLTLQNPYEIEIEIESVRLDTEGVDFDSAVESAVIGPYRTQLLRLSGTPRTAGSLHVTGAVIKVRGCRERRFPIFPQPWSPEGETKTKTIGLATLERQVALPPASLAGTPPKTEHISLNVIEQQPLVVVKSTTLPQSSVMILEGERQVFSVTLQNLSKTTPADFLLFSFRDSTQEPLQAALSRRDATAQELYEYELILARRQALRLRKRPDGDNRRYIEPSETATFDFEILGKPGLTSAVIQVDYAYLGVPPEEVAQKFFTRQATLQLTVTVNASVEVYRMDVLPLPEGIPRPLWKRSRRRRRLSSRKEVAASKAAAITADGGEEQDEGGDEDESEQQLLSPDEYCLLLLDLRNAWPSYMHVDLATEDGALVEETILPGNTMRVIVPLKRVFIDDPHAPVPALNPARQRQFVVSTSISPETERANREAFWYREKLLDSLRGTWRTTTSGASGGISSTSTSSIITSGSATTKRGAIELRSMRLTPRMIEAVKVEEVGIEIRVVEDGGAAAAAKTHKKEKNDNNVIYVDEFARLAVRITNRAPDPIHPTVRLMPALCHRPLNVALDFTRKLAWNGALQRALPVLPGRGATAEFQVGVMALCRGEFEITASVEETQLWRGGSGGGGEEEKNRRSGSGEVATTTSRPRSDTQALMDAALGARERRIWHSRRPCFVVATDRE